MNPVALGMQAGRGGREIVQSAVHDLLDDPARRAQRNSQ
jgi:hypothetical protein